MNEVRIARPSLRMTRGIGSAAGQLIIGGILLAALLGYRQWASPAMTGNPHAASGARPARPSPAPSMPGAPRLASFWTADAPRDPRALLAVAADGSSAVWTDALRGPAKVHVTGPGLAKVFVAGPQDAGPQAAAVSPDGATVAVVDGAGSLWTYDLVTGAARLVARGGPSSLVFGRSVAFVDAGHLLVQLVGTVEVPMPARIASVSVADGAVTILINDAWAFGPTPLDGGGIGYLHRQADGRYVARRLDAAGRITAIANVGRAVGWAAIGRSGAVAWSDGRTAFVVASPGAEPRALGDGLYPRFSPDGASLVIFNQATATSRWLSLDGTLLGSVDSPFAAAISCAGDC